MSNNALKQTATSVELSQEHTVKPNSPTRTITEAKDYNHQRALASPSDPPQIQDPKEANPGARVDLKQHQSESSDQWNQVVSGASSGSVQSDKIPPINNATTSSPSKVFEQSTVNIT